MLGLPNISLIVISGHLLHGELVRILTTAKEINGWRGYWGKHVPLTLDEAVQLPHLDGHWNEVARMFDLAVKEMNLHGGEKILEVGAGLGWASRRLADMGCKVVATDVVADRTYGLGMAKKIMAATGSRFRLSVVSGEHLPFHAGEFDVVFMSCALHHFATFDPVLSESYRVLRPGGQLIATGEPAIPLFRSEKAMIGRSDEVAEGITERRPYAYQYRRALRKAGFRNARTEVISRFNNSRIGRACVRMAVEILGGNLMVVGTKLQRTAVDAS